MAYNVLKGNVDFTQTQHTEVVDLNSNQEITGTKTIIGNLLAKDGRPIVPPALTTLEGRAKNGILVYQGDGAAKTENNLTFDGQTLRTKDIIANNLKGSAERLTKLPPNQFTGKIDARFLKLGHGIKEVRNNIQVETGPGLTTSAKGVELALNSKSGMSITSNRLRVDPKNCLNIAADGQNLSDDDLVVVHDASRGETRNTSLSNLYASYINSKIPHCAGPPSSVQIKGARGFEGSGKLTYDVGASVLKVEGAIVTDTLTVTGHTKFESHVTQNIKTVVTPTYEVAESDYTILCDTSQHAITAVLPPACNHHGRIMIFKKINTDKFKLHSHNLTVTVEEGEIDFYKSVEMKTTYSILTLQSDGKKWWIIGKTGS